MTRVQSVGRVEQLPCYVPSTYCTHSLSLYITPRANSRGSKNLSQKSESFFASSENSLRNVCVVLVVGQIIADMLCVATRHLTYFHASIKAQLKV